MDTSVETRSKETAHESVTDDSHTHPDSALGHVIEVYGAGAKVRLDPGVFGRLLAGAAGDDMRVGQIGSIVRIHVEGGFIYATVQAIHEEETEAGPSLVAVLDFFGQGDFVGGDPGRIDFMRGVYKFPVPGQAISIATEVDLHAMFSPKERFHISLGTVFPHHTVDATILGDGLLARHFAVLGSTGTGKSCCLSLMLHRLVEKLPYGHIIVLDPHNEYRAAFGDRAVHFDTNNLKLPYWLMNLEEHIELFIGQRSAERQVEVDILKRCLLAARKEGVSRRYMDRITVDTPIPYRITDLLDMLDTEMGRLEKPEKLLPFLRLKTKIEELKNDARYGFMFSGLLVSDSLQDIICRLLRFPVEDKPVSTIDLSGVPSDIVDVVVSVLCRLVFDFAVWSRQETSQPLLLVCEEAHRYIPEVSRDGFDSARKSLERIAKEGRKYGVSLGVVSQRPADLAQSVLSQCGTIFAMRMNNDRDQAFVEKVMPEGSVGFLSALPALQNREAIVVGEGVPAPLRMLFAEAEPHQMPTSTDPEFSACWQEDLKDNSFVKDVIDRWRKEMR